MTWDLVGIVSAVTAAVLGYLGLKAARKKDAAAAQTAVFGDRRAETDQVIGGYQGLFAEMRRAMEEAEKRCEDRIVDAVADFKRELTKRPTREELLDANGKLRAQLMGLGEVPKNGTQGVT